MSRKTVAGAAAVLATAALAGATIAPASAETTRQPSAGQTVLSLNNRVAGKIIGGCQGSGTVTVNLIGSATGSINPRNLKVALPVTALVTSDTGNVRIVHEGSGFSLANSCYEVDFTDFYVQDLGSGPDSSGFDVKVRRFDDLGEDGQPRVSTFTVDLTNASVKVVGKSTKIRSADLGLAAEGAATFNRLAGDPSGATGPFHTGDQLGKVRSAYRNPA